MKVRALSFNDDPSREAKLYACGECGKVYSPKNVGLKNAVEMAEKCCDPKQHVCRVCGVEVPSYRTMCQRHGEQARLRKAVQIEEADWTDPVQSDDCPGGWEGEGYFRDTNELRETWDVYHGDDEGTPAPLIPYCWPCVAKPLRLDPESLLEQAVDDMHEDASDDIVDADELCAFIEAWNAKQTCVSWYPDHSRVVVLDRERFEELLRDD